MSRQVKASTTNIRLVFLAIVLSSSTGTIIKLKAPSPLDATVQWSSSNSWDPPQTPGNSDDVVIDVEGNYTLEIRRYVSARAASIKVAADVTLLLSYRSNLAVMGACDIAGNLTLDSSSLLQCQRTSYLRGPFLLNGGSLQSTTSSIKPTINILGPMTVRSGSLYNIKLSIQNNFTMAGQQPSINLGSSVSIVVEDFAVFNMPNGGTISGSSGTLTIASQGLFLCATNTVCRISTPWTNYGSAVVKGTGKLMLSQSSTTTGSLIAVEGGSVVIAGGSTHYFNEQSIVNITGVLTDQSSSYTTTTLASRSLFIGSIQKTSSSKLYMVPQDHTISYVYVTSGLLQFTKRNTSAVALVNNLTVHGGEVKVASKAIVNELNTKSSTLTIDDQLTISSYWLWNGGTVRGTGSLVVYGTTEVNVTSHVYLYMYVKQFILHGIFIPRGPATLYVSSNQQVTVASDGVMTLRGDFNVRGTNNAMFDNWGQIDYGTEVGGTATINSGIFNNYGVVTVGAQNKSVTLVVNSGGTVNGKYIVEEGSTLNFSPSSHIDDDSNGLITGGGTLLITGSSSYTTTLRNIDIDYILVQSSTLNLQPNPTSDDQFRLNNLTVRGGNCIINAFTDKLYITTLAVSAGSVTVSAPFACDVLTVTGGTVDMDADVTVHKTCSLTSGTIRGNGYNTVNASTLQVESTSSGTTYLYLYSVTVRVWSRFVARSHHLRFSLRSGSQLKFDSTTTADVGGSSLTFETDASGVIENYGVLAILDATVNVNVGLHNFGTIYLNNSDMTITQLSTCSGSIAIAINSTLSLSNTLVMTADGTLQGSGELKVTSGSSRLFGVTIQTLSISGGTTVLNLGAQQMKEVQVAGGTLEIKTSYDPNQQTRPPRKVDRISVVSGTLESDDTFLINELLVRGGRFLLNADSYVYGAMQWTGGNIEGQTYSQVSRIRLFSSSLSYINMSYR